MSKLSLLAICVIVLTYRSLNARDWFRSKGHGSEGVVSIPLINIGPSQQSDLSALSSAVSIYLSSMSPEC